ncbi:MAG: tail fiber assembly protein [Burkholderia gladioli]
MFYHAFDNKTGEYQGTYLPRGDPRNAERWIYPAWTTTDPVPERTRTTWPFWNQQQAKWGLKPDLRGQTLYRTDNGTPTEIMQPGVSPEDVGLTDKARPSEDYTWDGKAWAIDAKILARKQREAAMAEFERRLALAKTENTGKADALAAELLDDTGVALFKAWAQYQMDCIKVVESPAFPDKTPWPLEPDPKAIAAQIHAEKENAEAQPKPTKPEPQPATGEASPKPTAS